MRRVPALARRVLRSPGRIDEQHLLLQELSRRVTALEQQVEHLHARLEGADPRATYDIVAAVQDSVRELSVQVTESLNAAEPVPGEREEPASSA